MNDGTQLIAEIPPVWLRSEHSRLFVLLPTVSNGILLVMIWIIITASGYFMTLPVWLLLIVYGLFGLWMLGAFVVSAAFRTKLLIDQQNFQLQRWFLGWCYQKLQGKTQEISQVELKGIGLSMNKAPITVCTLRSRLRQHRFGSFLTEPEKAWLMAEVKDFLEKQYTIEKLETSNKSEV